VDERPGEDLGDVEEEEPMAAEVEDADVAVVDEEEEEGMGVMLDWIMSIRSMISVPLRFFACGYSSEEEEEEV
jgi:hypothetical protein